LALLCIAISAACAQQPDLGTPGAQPPEPSAQHPEPGARAPHIAVLLPLKSASFSRPADAVRRGIFEAQRVHQGSGLPVIVYATGEDPFDIVQTYERAVREGTRLVIGPLTRSAVSALASSNLVNVPTLALNSPEAEIALPPNLYVFGLQVEFEARQIAQLAAEQGRRKALMIVADTPLSRRLSQAFADEFAQRKGSVAEQFLYTQDPAALMKLRDSLALGTADMAFLAVDGARAKAVRSYLGAVLPVYATSLVHTTSDTLANFELNGVVFVDMPWLLVPDHPAVLTYARPEAAGQSTMEFQRFYAVGIDAFRLAQDLLKPRPEHAPLDGVTGYITLGPDRRFARELIPAQFVQGEPKGLVEARPR
jgi:outer membrane PBP1 activator LpoA protein